MNLSEIKSPASIKSLSQEELQALAKEIREKIIRTVAVNGGHLASNLGAVELTIALHRAFDCPQDKIIFDVGHQCYTHKILTGRYDRFETLRKTDGICGFPRREESPCDAFDTGHASTALSAALGMIRARDLKHENYRVVAVVGDGAMTGGMVYEALNDAGSGKTPFMLVLNDNGMSISRNVGALSRQLTRLRISRGWLSMKKRISDALRKIPVCGERLHDVFENIKNRIRNILVKDKFFSSLGFSYFGPIDGHDIAGMERVFRQLKDLDRPVVVHVATQKGCGFSQAEEKPEKYHGVAPFRLDNGELRGGVKQPSLGQIAGEYITQLAKTDSRICAVTAAMTDSAGFGGFAKQFPDRTFDVGIAEEHAVTMAAGMAAAGMRPFVAIYETFFQRAFDQITEDVCLQNLPVCLLMDRAGLNGDDGATHHGIYGLAMLRAIPNLKVFAPRNPGEMKAMIDWAMKNPGPCAILYPRTVPVMDAPEGDYHPGKWETLREGKDAVALSWSSMLTECLEAAKLLEKDGISMGVVNASALYPLDETCLLDLMKSGVPVFTAEEHSLSGGFGSAVAECCARAQCAFPKDMLGLPNAFIEHGNRKELLHRYGLDAEGIARRVKEAVKP
ncbi:MAG: 1-deoxy-D-xylulose-5-phosphate synthase [Clostridia bacterium]|nr:1-deoxy-D-xylulose-5-phosphate synthase [Clostridia bacterium]